MLVVILLVKRLVFEASSSTSNFLVGETVDQKSLFICGGVLVHLVIQFSLSVPDQMCPPYFIDFSHHSFFPNRYCFRKVLVS